MFTLQILGALDLQHADGRSVRSLLAQPKRFGVLAYLALHQGFRRRDVLLPIFWPHQDQEHARAALRKVIYHLRQSLGDEAVVGRGDEEIAFGDSVLKCDARSVRQALDCGDVEAAVESYRGELLPGFFLSDLPEFERWLDSEREKLRLDMARAAEAVAEAKYASGKLPEAVEWTRRRLELTPADEVALRRLLGLLDEVGDRSGAIAAFEHFCTQLRLTYDLEPAAETCALVDQIRVPRNSTDDTLPAEAEQPATGSGMPRRVDLAAPAIGPEQPAGTRLQLPVNRRVSRRPPAVLWASFAVVALFVVRDPALSLVQEAFGRIPFSSSEAAQDLSIAVLPITDVSPGAGGEYLSVGMTDELINALGRLQGLRVAARTSTFALADGSTDIREMARQLGVRYVLEGSLRREGNHVRLSLQLIDATDGQQRWAGRYDREMSTWLTMQEEISRSVIAALDGPLPLVSPAKQATSNPEAYDDYLRGRFLLSQGTEEAVGAAVRHFASAIARDSSYALAYAGLADAHLAQANWLTPRSVLPRAKLAAERAIQLNADHFETHLALAKLLHRFDWDWAGAEERFKRALELAPDEPSVHYQYADFLRASRRFDESIAETRQGLALEKIGATKPLQYMVHERETLALALFRNHRYQEAISMAELALELDPSSGARLTIVYASQMVGDFGRATMEMDRVASERGAFERGPVPMARNFAHAGKTQEAHRLLERKLEEADRRYIPKDQIAQIYLAVGDTATAVETLEAAVDERNFFMVFWNSDPFAESLREDARFISLLRRMNSPM